ncbi:MAG: hypothetical protein M1829_000783 [Trizodia sp. TS-e1964]|nr:MAG: hypothetical protein M1829_000783 [Trizodia sp. TS-e1964]
MATAPEKPFLETIKKSFVDVSIDRKNGNAISTSDFLAASESLTTLFDVLGSAAFKPVKSDMIGNIKKIRERQLAAPNDSETLQALVINELKTGTKTASEGLVWLVRGLDFTAQALIQNLAQPNEELSTSFRTAYGGTLKEHHSFLVKPIFSAAMSATPYRKDFYVKLGSDQEEGHTALSKWLAALEEQVKILKAFQATKEAKI